MERSLILNQAIVLNPPARRGYLSPWLSRIDRKDFDKQSWILIERFN